MLFAGAFAFFGPGKFENVYTSLNSPAAGGLLHFAGEAISTRHAWVEGALDSAWRAVFEMLLQPEYQSYRKKFFENWGINAEWFSASTGDAPPLGVPPPCDPAPHTPLPGGWQGKQPIFHQPPQGPEGDGFDVDRLLRDSLLVKHIALTHPEL